MFTQILREELNTNDIKLTKWAKDVLIKARKKTTKEVHKGTLPTTILALKRLELQRIEAALEKIERGTYLLCGGCGDRIDPKRIKVRPSSLICQECQKNLEV